MANDLHHLLLGLPPLLVPGSVQRSVPDAETDVHQQRRQTQQQVNETNGCKRNIGFLVQWICVDFR
ncbi:MAG: hypothetical protein AAFP69_19415 [Planctomycetota bacterium]